MRRGGRRPEPRIENLATDLRRTVGLCVAAEYLQMDTRTVRARIDAGELDAFSDGRVCRVTVASLAAYVAARRWLAS